MLQSTTASVASEEEKMNERVLLSAAVITAALAFGPASAVAAPATDGPGAMSHFDLARKDCVGTARNDRSKVWFTVADGVLSDVYYPTNDNTNVRDAAVRRHRRLARSPTCRRAT